jgi:hypothetical protein
MKGNYHFLKQRKIERLQFAHYTNRGKQIMKISTNRLIRKVLINSFSIFLLLTGTTIADAQQSDTGNPEKPIIIKGIYLGMDIDEARKIVEQLVNKDWTVSAVGLTDKIAYDYRFIGGEEKIFGGQGTHAYTFPPIVGEKGFAIQNKASQSFQGYISTDKSSNKVIRISLGGKLVDYIFSSENIAGWDFQEEFRKSYNLPDLNWIPYGWAYFSDKGFTLKIMTDKLIDLEQKRDK